MLTNTLERLGTASLGATGVLIPTGIGGTGSIDCSGTDWLAIQLGGTYTATVIVEGSYDGVTNWAPLATVDTLGAVTNAGVTTTGHFMVQTAAPYARIRVSAYTSGMVQLFGGTSTIQNSPVNH